MADTHIEFPEPCQEDWDGMHPLGRARHCDSCDKPVHDLTQYTPEEADALIHGAGGPACLRAHIAADGRVITKPSPFGKLLTAAVAAPAIFIALAAVGAAADPTTGAISGSVKAGHTAPLSVTAVADGVVRTAPVATDGTYRLDQLPPGAYRLEFKVRNAVWWAVDQVAVRANYVTVRKADTPPPEPGRTGPLARVVAGDVAVMGAPPIPPRRPPPVMVSLVTAGIPMLARPPVAPSPPVASASATMGKPAPPTEEVVVSMGRIPRLNREVPQATPLAIRSD